jgi:uncharacterized protein
MARPCKCRHITDKPGVTYFKPRAIPLTELEEVNLTLDEFEAIRLADFEGLYQEEAAVKMHISRQTFGNIVTAAHKKIADAIVNGKAVRIEGGTCKTGASRQFQCEACRHIWDIPCGTGRPEQCPKCHKNKIFRISRNGMCKKQRTTCSRKPEEGESQ